MPQLIFKGVSQEDVKTLSKYLPDQLSSLTKTPRDYFTFECPQTNYFFDGELMLMYPLVEIKQFKRSQDVENQMAKLIQESIKNLNYNECEVYFIHLNEANYYE